jgi:hypothetical protein
MLDFLDISLSSSDKERPYLIFLFERGAVTDVTRHQNMASVAAYCQQKNLPVVSSSPTIRSELRAHNISAQPFEVRAVGK